MNTTSPPSSNDVVTVESLTTVDLSTLSQSELHLLSRCSNSAFHPQNDVVLPQINPSLFNKSAGTRRQTYSRPYRRRRVASACNRPLLPAGSLSNSVNSENKSIVNHLKNLLGETQTHDNSNSIVIGCNRKRKREEIGLDDAVRVNKKGDVVDLEELGNADELYVGELGRRAEGVRSEEEGLGFLRGLEGKWCSSRKKRKFVDADEFGDRFPVGWKMLLALKRKGGQVSLYCRRYVSPSGEHFLSCKEAAAFLKSHFGDGEKQSRRQIDQRSANHQPVNEVDYGNGASPDFFAKDVELIRVNKNGEVVNFSELRNADELYSGELRRRTDGLESEEQGLGYLRGLEGQWCSTRKKRKFVDAGDFGDKFPVGWRLLLALKRKNGCVSVYCRRYVSPTGEHFLSCKEAAAFLKSHFGDDEKRPIDRRSGTDQPVNEVACGTGAPPDCSVKDIELFRVNQNGVVVDFEELGNADELYSGVLRRRTEGLGSEEEGLGYFRGLEGQWCSTRKKRKFVDACNFGDKFPVGWKLLLSLKRKDGRVTVYCRRYVSPTGEQFLSCKEAASFLKSHFRDGEKQPMDQTVQSIANDLPVNEKACASGEGLVDKDILTLPGSSISGTVADANFLGDDNLTEVQVQNIYECEKCKKTYHNKDEYLQHLLLVHKDTTRRYEPSTTFGRAVFKDGKYVCRFCHQSFDEKHNYSTHMGLHVRNVVRKFEEWPPPVPTRRTNESTAHDVLAAEIAQDSTVANSNGHMEKPDDDSSPYNVDVQDISAAVFDWEPSCHLNENNNCMADAALYPELKPSSDEHMTTEEEVVKIDGLSSNTLNSVDIVSTNTSDHIELDAVGNYDSRDNNVQPNNLAEDAWIGYSPAVVEPENFMLNSATRRQVTSACVWCRVEFEHEAIDSKIQSDSIGFMCPTCKDTISGKLDGYNG